MTDDYQMTATDNAMQKVTQYLGARTLLVAPGLTTSNKKLLETKGIATRSKDATSSLEQNLS